MPLGVGTVIRLDINRSIRTRQPMTYLTPTWISCKSTATTSGAAGLGPDAERAALCRTRNRCPTNSSSWRAIPTSRTTIPRVGAVPARRVRQRVRIYQDREMSAGSRCRCVPGPARRSCLRPLRRHEDAGRVWRMSDVVPGAGKRAPRHHQVSAGAGDRPAALGRPPVLGRRRAYQQHAVVSMNASLHVKRLHGVVPVEADGSALLRSAAEQEPISAGLGRGLPGSAADADLRQSPARRNAGLPRLPCRAALGPRRQGGLGPPPAAQCAATAAGRHVAGRPLHYVTDVQPILDRHCVRCHNPDQADGELDLSGTLTTLFNRSYENLLRKDLVQVFHENDPKTGDAAPVPPYTLGSHASRLVKLLRQGHEDVTLSREEFIRLVTWIDSNSAYYGTYFGRRNLKYRHEPDFRPLPADEFRGIGFQPVSRAGPIRGTWRLTSKTGNRTAEDANNAGTATAGVGTVSAGSCTGCRTCPEPIMG